jgi:hypothetical protein
MVLAARMLLAAAILSSASPQPPQPTTSLLLLTYDVLPLLQLPLGLLLPLLLLLLSPGESGMCCGRLSFCLPSLAALMDEMASPMAGA